MQYKKHVFVPLIFIFFVFSCYKKPRIEFNEIIHDFGQVSQKTELKHIFNFKNTGSSTLTIEKIKAG